jgi:hypothetical protein
VAVLAVVRTDTDLPSTIRDLGSTMRYALFERIWGNNHRRALVQMLGGGSDSATAPMVRTNVMSMTPFLHDFDLSQELQSHLRGMGVSRFAPVAFNLAPFAALIPSAPNAPFSGVGATGVNPATLSVPLDDQALMAAGNRATRDLYDNPLGDLAAYLAPLSSLQRRQQAQLLVTQGIVSVVPDSYRAWLPSRAEVIRIAASRHSLHPALLAAFMLAEQRDQSRNEDAKDLAAGTSSFG